MNELYTLAYRQTITIKNRKNENAKIYPVSNGDIPVLIPELFPGKKPGKKILQSK